MQARDAWTPNDEEAKAVYAYLESLPPTATGPVSFTVRRVVADLPAGDPTQGETVYRRACQTCHGEIHTGEGRIVTSAPALPEETLMDHATYSKDEQRLVVVEKVRHGGFLGYGGIMPPFSLEAMSDAELGGLLAYLGLYR
jgi:thiosulfate dehydrogenase